MYYNSYDRWPEYVSAAERRARAAAYAKKLEKERGRPLLPVKIEGREIARTFWGKAWCDNLESYSDLAYRLERGRRYARNGSVFHLEIAKGEITALVSGSEIYNLTIKIEACPPKAWRALQGDCAKSITSLLDLLQGRFDRGVMERLTRKGDGLFPKPKELKMKCSCPDYAGLCKHLAAVLFCIGARLDQSPEMLFTLRNVDHLELISQAATAENLEQAFAGESKADFGSDDLSSIFGIELETASPKPNSTPAPAIKPRTKLKVAKAKPPAVKSALENKATKSSGAGKAKAKAVKTRASTASAAAMTTKKRPAADKPAARLPNKPKAKSPAKRKAAPARRSKA